MDFAVFVTHAAAPGFDAAGAPDCKTDDKQLVFPLSVNVTKIGSDPNFCCPATGSARTKSAMDVSLVMLISQHKDHSATYRSRLQSVGRN